MQVMSARKAFDELHRCVLKREPLVCLRFERGLGEVRQGLLAVRRF
jgi:hypothetical protein